MIIIVGGAIAQTVTGFIQLPSVEKSGRKSKIEDFSLQVYGWKQLGSKFGELSRKYEQEGSIREDSPLVTYRWFPAANLEYYVARPAGKVVLAAGELDAIHHYAWINNRHGGFRLIPMPGISLQASISAIRSPCHLCITERIFLRILAGYEVRQKQPIPFTCTG
jgi:hypothetical protein